MRPYRFLCALLIFTLCIGLNQAQEAALISPSVFLRGLELANGVRYTATFIKPTDDTVLRNLSLEITLPADAQFTEMLVSRQVQFDVIRRNRQGQLTLIWQISRVDAETPLDAFAFTVAEPLNGELEFYLLWQDEQGQVFLENFFEEPSLIRANETEASISPINSAFAFVGNTGIQVSATTTNPLNFNLLANDFNPPAEYGAVWWCSLLDLTGLAQGDSALVLVPLRRPVAPFSELFLFQQQADGSWLGLEEKGIVSADGQFVLYQHLGGLMATGGDEEIRQEAIPVEEAVIEEAPPPQENPPQNNEPAPQPAPVQEQNVVEVQPAPVEQNPVENNNPPPPTAIPPSPIPATLAPAPTQAVRDGTSNTIIISEATNTQASLVTPAPILQATVTPSPSNIIRNVTNGTVAPTFAPLPTLGDGSVRFISSPSPTQGISDGTSNTIFVGEATFTPTAISNGAILPPIGDGSVRFISSPTPTQGVPDGSSNTIIISEATFTPTSIPNGAILPPIGDGSVRFISSPSPTQGISDGTSNTIFVGEATFTPTAISNGAILPPIGDGSVRFISSPSPTQGVSDGSSNTIFVGEATFTPTAISNGAILPPIGDGSVRFISSPSPTQGVPDGSSNTIFVGEATFTPTQGVSDGTSNTIIISEAIATEAILVTPTVINEVTITATALVATATETSSPLQNPSATPSLVIVPTQIIIVTPPPFGTGGTRVLIVQAASGELAQCQVGGLLCAPLKRRAGNGFR